MIPLDDEDQLLRSVAFQNANSILLARQPVEDELRRTKAALVESRERLTTALSAACIGTFRWDTRTREFQADDNLNQLFGLGHLPLDSWDQFIAAVHADDRSAVVAGLNACSSAGTDLDVEFRILWPDGSLHWIDKKAKCIRDPEGTLIYTTATCVDVTNRKEADRERRRLTERLSLAADVAKLGVWEWDLASSTLTCDATMSGIGGFAPVVQMSVEHWLAAIYPDDVPQVRSALRQAIEQQTSAAIEFRIVWPDESLHWVDTRARFLADEQRPGRLLGVTTDITARKALEDALFTEQERARITLHSIADGVISTDIAGCVTYLNAAAERLTGWLEADALARPLGEVFNHRRTVAAGDAGLIAPPTLADLQGHCQLTDRDGGVTQVHQSSAPINDRNGHITGAVTIFRDVSVERTVARKMAHLAHYDVLTDLPNRTLLDDRIGQAIEAAGRQGSRLAVLFVDVDLFKHINDSWGHAVGDALLKSITGRLRSCVRGSDTVSRRGGDEFVVLLPHMTHSESVGIVAEKVIAAVAAPHQIGESVLHVTASIGISTYPDDAQTIEGLITAADAAMYHAKESGHNNYKFFTGEMNARSVSRRSLESALHAALEQRQFALHYQPKFDLETSRITAVEALVRWHHPERGLLVSADFIPAAEECGLILPLGRWVLREACRQAHAWQEQGLAPLPVAVNVSGLEFQGKGFLEHVRAVLEDTQLSPDLLEFEVTESVLMADAAATTAALYALKDLGAHLAIDDFGTGYSSLSYLSRFPIDTLKIDRSFIQGITHAGQDAAIINGIIGLGQSLHQRVVAEGVENQEQLALLRRQRCEQGQGYYFSRPVPAAQLADLVRADAARSCRPTVGM
jgi:diguanylate cyclase (GGDEF)-like protein/PAS domain S-box-containing protein